MTGMAIAAVTTGALIVKLLETYQLSVPVGLGWIVLGLVVGIIVGRRNEHLVHLDVERLGELLQAARAPQREVAPEVARGEDPLDHGLQQKLALDRAIVGHAGQLAAQALERAAEHDAARGSRVADEVVDLDRVDRHA